MSTAQTINPNVDSMLDNKDFKFRFRKDKLGNQRPSVELKLPVPSVEGIVNILETGGKGLELLLEVCSDVVRNAALSIVGDDEKISQETFPLNKITWGAIANQPRQERRTISDELWEAFCADYIAIMPGITAKSIQAVTNATLVFIKKFAQVKADPNCKEIVRKLQDQLALYMEHSSQAEQFTEILELLNSKAEVLLAAKDSSTNLIDNL